MVYTESSLAAVVLMAPRLPEMSREFVGACADYWWHVWDTQAKHIDAADVFVLYCMGGEL